MSGSANHARSASALANARLHDCVDGVLRIVEVPVVMRQRSAGCSSITPIRSLYYMVKVTLAILVQFIGRNPTSEEPE